MSDEPVQRRRKIFPDEVTLRTFAKATLAGVTSSFRDRIGRYTLDAIDEPEYVLHLEALRGVEGLRFSVVPGLWASYRIVKEPDEDEKLELCVGLDESSMRDQVAAMGAVGSPRDVIVPAFLVRALAFGYLDRVGA
jgi:hypothetical protein